MKKLDPQKIKDKIMKIGLKTGCGHVASAMSCVDLLCALYNLEGDNMIILSKGHGALAQYVILNELGIMPKRMLNTYYKDGGLSGHATLDPKHGIYASTGSLGHGLAIGIGYAMANPEKSVHVVLGDGELDEGSTLESLRIIERLQVKNIFPHVDVNDLQGFGETFVFPLNKKELVGHRFGLYFSTKGEGWGDLEGRLDSHYQKITSDLYKIWTKNKKKS